MKPEDISQYCSLMDEIKLRTEVVHGFSNGQCRTIHRATTIESICLQIRKILELVALGSLVANKKKYAEQHEKFHKYSHANRILRDIEGINPQFYPKPLIEAPSNRSGVKNDLKERKSGFLTRDHFAKVYEKCGNILHADNPLGSKSNYAYYEKKIPKWMEEIRNLLNTHSIFLVDDPNMYLIHMKEKDGKAHGYTFAPMKKSPDEL